MFYKIEPRKNPMTKEVKYHAIAKSIGMITSRQIAEELAARSALTAGDMYDTLDNLRSLITQWLIQGFTVRLDGLGTFRLTTQSDGAETAQKFTPAYIRRTVVRIIAEKQLRESVKNNIHYESIGTLEARLNGHSKKADGEAATSPDANADAASAATGTKARSAASPAAKSPTAGSRTSHSAHAK